MTQHELNRYSLLRQVLSKQLTQAQAAKSLELSERQVRNLLRAIKLKGAKGIISKKRGKPSNRALDNKFKTKVLTLVREKYSDFGPTFASEKLLENHQITISNETLRKWMIEEHLWVSKKQRSRIYPLRPRRDYFGELIQIDGSHHHWFENRGDKCVLIVFIDDATSKITSLFFCRSECLEGYFIALQKHVTRYGRPLELYSDRHTIFGGSDNCHHAQFTRALEELEIKSILARSPQAKGRVERVNQTLQDRLIKEMRLKNISTIEDANLYLPQFIEEFNKKFSKEPRGLFDAHRPLDVGYDLERTLTRCETRTLSKDLSFSFYNTTYQILESSMVNRLKYKKIEVRLKWDETFRVFQGEKELKYIPLREYIPKKIVDCKEKLVWSRGRGGHPSKNHPWKRCPYPWLLSKHIKLNEAMI